MQIGVLIGIMENKMETTILYRVKSYRGRNRMIMKNEMETKLDPPPCIQ